MLSFAANCPKDALDDAPLEILENLSSNELFARGRNLMFRKDHSDQKKGFELLKIAANKGNTHAIMFLSNTTSFREDIRLSPEELVKYIRKGCELEDQYCLSKYANMLMNGEYVPQNKKEALKYLKKGIELGDTSKLDLYAKLQNEIDQPINYPPDIAKIKELADQGDSDSMIELANILIQGELVERDCNESHKYLFAAAEQGNAEAYFILGCFSEQGVGFEIDS